MVFGNVVRLADTEGEKDYVFLGLSPDGRTVFLAVIPDISKSGAIISLHNRRSVQPPSQKILRAMNSPVFFYVQLTTEQFRGRIAMLHKPDEDETIMVGYKDLPSLCEVDLVNIKNEILNAPADAVNPVLRKIVHDLG